MLWLFIACANQFDQSVSSGTWVQSDFKFNFNADCGMNSVLGDGLNLTYQFGEFQNDDSGYYYYSEGVDPDIIGSYVNNLWGYCNGRDDSPSFYCSAPLVLAHYNTWKENFPLELAVDEYGTCTESSYSSQVTCEEAGSCDDEQWTDQESCEEASAVWTSAGYAWTSCEVVFDYGGANGLFIDNTTIKISSNFRAACRRYITNSSGYEEYQDDKLCQGAISSTLTKQ